MAASDISGSQALAVTLAWEPLWATQCEHVYACLPQLLGFAQNIKLKFKRKGPHLFVEI